MEENFILNNFKCKINLKEKKGLSQHLNKIKHLNLPEFFKSFKKNYKYSYNKKIVQKYKKHKIINIIGMGGSSLGTKAIYNFLKDKIKKKVTFSENLNLKEDKKNNGLNVVISKSGINAINFCVTCVCST